MKGFASAERKTKVHKYNHASFKILKGPEHSLAFLSQFFTGAGVNEIKFS